MSRLVPFVLFATLFLSPTAPASAQSDALPAVDANYAVAPLTVDQLDPAERASFAALPPNGDAARKFLYTRGYLRFARRVVNGTLPAPQMPNIPEPGNYDRGFLSSEESTIVDTAIYRFLMDPNSRSAG